MDEAILMGIGLFALIMVAIAGVTWIKENVTIKQKEEK